MSTLHLVVIRGESPGRKKRQQQKVGIQRNRKNDVRIDNSDLREFFQNLAREVFKLSPQDFTKDVEGHRKDRTTKTNRQDDTDYSKKYNSLSDEEKIKHLEQTVKDLADKLQNVSVNQTKSNSNSNSNVEDVTQAMVNLGFKKAEAKKYVEQAVQELGDAASEKDLMARAVKLSGPVK